MLTSVRTALTTAILVLTIFNSDTNASADKLGYDCFTKADSKATPYRVFQIARMPESTRLGVDDTETSPYYPGTDFLTAANSVVNADPHFKAYLLSWINRCQFLQGQTHTEQDCSVKRRANGDAIVTPKGNSYQGEPPERNLRDQVRAAFSSYSAADSCSIAQEMQALGLSDAAIDARSRGTGLTLYRNVDRSSATMRPLTQTAELADGTRWDYLVNLCVLPEKNSAKDFTGLALDYEVNDNRSTALTNAFLSEYTDLAHRAGKKVALAINPLPRIASGLDESNVSKIISQLDYVIISLTNGASPGNPNVGNKQRDASTSILSSYQTQIDVVTNHAQIELTREQKSHIIWQVPLYQVPLSEAASLQAVVRREGFGGVSIFRNYVEQGGACSRESNQLTACIALGQCSGRFGLGRF